MSDKYKLNWEGYEAITKYIYEALGARYGIKIKGYGRQFKVKGKSGVQHQVDVLTEQFDGKQQLLTAIECKHWKKKVTKDTVMKLSETIRDAGIANGIIVCKTGFTRDTLTYAAHVGIKLVELSEVGEHEADFEKKIEIGTLDIRAKIMITRPNITGIDLGSRVITGEEGIMGMYYAVFRDSNGKATPFSRYLVEFSDELQSRGGLLMTATKDFPLTGKLFWKMPVEVIAIEKISITGFLTKTDRCSERSFLLTDQVWMIMKELFDKKNIALTKSGLLWNLPSNC